MAEKQEELTGGGIENLKPPKIKAIDEAALAHREVVSKRLKIQEKEADTADALQKVLHKHEDKLVIRDKDGNPGYVFYDGDEALIAVLKRTEEKVSVRKYLAPKAPKEAGAKE